MQLNCDFRAILFKDGVIIRIAAKVELNERRHKQLKAWATGRLLPVRLAKYAKMILLAAQADKEIGVEVGVWRGTVGRWRMRFIE